MVHGGDHGNDHLAIGKGENRDLGARQELLDDNVAAALSKDFVLHAGAHCRHRLLACHGHGDAFAQGQAIGLNHSGDGGGL